MKKIFVLISICFIVFPVAKSQTLSEQQMINARATGYAIVAARNPGQSFSIFLVPWDGVNSLEYNANTQINAGWHAQAVIKGNYFYQVFDGSDFSRYSTVLCSQQEFDQYKNTGTQWWIVCSTLPPFSSSISSIYSGNIGIGTSSPTEKLSVNGNIRSKKLIVTQTGWADYVFKPAYKLKPISEVEKYIKENQHLPDIPSQKEVEENGVDVGATQAVLLKKIEELTLYVIEVKNENQHLKSEVEQLKNLTKKK